MSKKLFIKTYGCQMNVYDSIKMQELLAPFGFESADVDSLMKEVDGWIDSGLADVGNEAILARFRGTKIYQKLLSSKPCLVLKSYY